MGFLLLYHYFIVLSLLVSILTYKERSPLYLKLMSPFLFLTLLTECYSSYLSTINRNNISIYNFFSAFEFGFYLFLISLIIRSARVKKFIWITIGVYFLVAVTNILFVQGIKTFHTTSYAIGCLLVVAFCIYFFYELFRAPSRGKLQYNPAFWICTALLFFYCCGFPLYGLMNLWARTLPLVVNSFETITTILNSILYSLFTIAFLCTRTRNYISSSS
jgi:hypothetical protein